MVDIVTKRLFILEDEENVCDMYRKFLTSIDKNLEIDIYEDIDNALDALMEHKTEYWDCFLSDLVVPFKNNKLKTISTFNLIETLPSCKTIVATGYASPEIKSKLIELNIAALFIKPVDLHSLYITINSIINCT